MSRLFPMFKNASRLFGKRLGALGWETVDRALQQKSVASHLSTFDPRPLTPHSTIQVSGLRFQVSGFRFQVGLPGRCFAAVTAGFRFQQSAALDARYLDIMV
jgi:hypothetical protein